jgi:uncharacterized protein (DUF302 family)
VIDQAGEARQAGLDCGIPPLVIFGSPAAGTPVLAASPLAALDVPLWCARVGRRGAAAVFCYAPAALAARRHPGAGLAANLAGIAALTDALAAP